MEYGVWSMELVSEFQSGQTFSSRKIVVRYLCFDPLSIVANAMIPMRLWREGIVENREQIAHFMHSYNIRYSDRIQRKTTNNEASKQTNKVTSNKFSFNIIT